jgi:hypothetical protein
MGSDRHWKALDIERLQGGALGKGVHALTDRLDALRKRTRQQLLEVARALELKGVSKLRKDQLAGRVLEALRARLGHSDAGAAAEAEGVEPMAPMAGLPEEKRQPAEAGAGTARVPLAAELAPPRPEAPAGERPLAAAKLDLGPAAPVEKQVEQIPWSYGVDRVTAVAVDPDKLAVYWEVTDPAIERARAGLGPGGPGAWLDLRVYDTSGLIFDGTNAHGYFDHGVERGDRQWFFEIGRPSSTAIVELGMKSSEGYFVRIARSGRVDFPRKEPVPWGDPEWMVVRAATGEAMRAAGPAHRTEGASLSVPGPASPPARFAPIPLWELREAAGGRELHAWEILERGFERVEWQETSGEGWFELQGRLEWEGPAVMTTWEAGPFSYPVQVDPPRREEWEGRSFAYKVGDVTRVVHGPWQVVIRNLGAHAGRTVLGRWEIHRSWAAQGGGELRGATAGATVAVGASEQIGGGASALRWMGASELRLAGASEFWRVGASELRLRGASEQLFKGASELRLAGASERRLRGASERRLRGASERMLRGGSERRLGGASERRLGGASERQLGEAGERAGASELRLAGDQAAPSYPPLEGDHHRTAE